MENDVKQAEMPETGEVATVTQDDVDVGPKSIETFLSAVEVDDFVNAEKEFNSLIGDRLQDTLDQAKIRLAGSIFNDQEEESESEEDEEETFEDEDELEVES